MPNECYEKTKSIEFIKTENEVDSRILEIYLINRYNPVYNTEWNYKENPTIEIKMPKCQNLNISTFNLTWLK